MTSVAHLYGTEGDAPADPIVSPVQRREPFLDVVRAASVVRVVLWHTFGAAWLTYVVSAVPAMFFVTGSLLARSLDRSGLRATLLDRARRLLLPLWLFSLMGWVAMAVAAHMAPGPATALVWPRLLWWILPLDDPQGSAWEAGWLSSPLWYLRAMMWLLVAAPLLRRLTRRRPWPTIFVLVLAVVVLDLAVDFNGGLSRSAHHLGWLVGDLALYSLFLIAGFCHRDGRLQRIRRNEWLQYAAVAALGAVVWVATQPVPGHVVNDSHPLHLMMGAAWLCLGLAFAAQVAQLAERGPLASSVGWLTRRSLTVYLWHAVAIVVAYRTLTALAARLAPGPWPTGVFAMATLALVFGVTVALAVMVGWLEDVAGRRKASWWPRSVRLLDSSLRPLEPGARRAGRRPLIAVVTASVLVVLLGFVAAPTDASSTAELVLPRAPSRAPILPAASLPFPLDPARGPAGSIGDGDDSEAAPSSVPPPRAARADASALYVAQPDNSVAPTELQRYLAPPASQDLADALSAEVVTWLAETNTAGVEVLVLKPGELRWRAAFGVDPVTKEHVTVGQRFDSNSITKTFTAALVYRLIERGRLELDEPVPALSKVPTLPAGAFTVRQLLNHTSGLVGYRDTPEFRSAAGLETPEDALRASLEAPRLNEPGEAVNYSSSNYLVLGFLIEQVTGRSYDDLLRKELLEPLQLNHSSHNAPAPGWPNFATGGLVTTTDDLARWLVALLRDDAVLDRDSLDHLTEIDRATGLGAGIWGYCPCDDNQSGGNRFVGFGHSGGTTQMQYSPTDDVVIVANLTSAIPELGDGSDALSPLFQQLRDLVWAHR